MKFAASIRLSAGSIRTLRLAIIAGSVSLAVVAHGQKPQLVVQTGHSRGVTSVAFSTDDQLALTGSEDHTARLWETITGRELRRFEGHSDTVTSVAFSRAGRFILTGSSDGTARLWDPATGKELHRFKGQSGFVASVAFSPDDRFVLTGGEDKTARLWDAHSGKQVGRFDGHSESLNSVAFSPDGRFILTGSDDKTACLWQATTGKEVRRFKGHSDAVFAVSFSSSGRNVLTGSSDGTARLWETATARELRQFRGHFRAGNTSGLEKLRDESRKLLGDMVNYGEALSRTVSSVAFSQDDKVILTGGFDGTARLWDAATGKELRRFEGGSGAYQITSVAFSPDSQLVLTGGNASDARLWEAATGKEIHYFGGTSAAVHPVVFSPDGQSLLTGHTDGIARRWDLTAGKQVQRLEGHTNWLQSAAFSPEGRFILTGSVDQTMRLWETASGKEIRKVDGHDADLNSVASVAFSPDGRFILDSTSIGARLLETRTGLEVRKFGGPPEAIRSSTDFEAFQRGLAQIESLSFSHNGRFVAMGRSNGTAQLWEVETGTELRSFSAHPGSIVGSIESVAFSPDDRSVLTGGDGARMWDTETGKELRQFDDSSAFVRAIGFSPDAQYVISAGSSSPRLWKTATGEEVRRFQGHSDSVNSAAFSADGRIIATGSNDATSRLWDVASGRELCRLVSFTDGTWAVVDPEGRFDTDNLEEIKGLHWVMPDDPMNALPLEIFMRDYYEPGLLARILKRETLKPVKDLSKLNRVQPKAAITAVVAEPDKPEVISVTVEVTGVLKKTGVSDVRLFRDGQLVGYRDGEVKLTDNKATLTFPGIHLPRVEDGKNVEFSAYAFNDDRVKSSTAKKSYAIPTGLKPVKGRAYVISVGVNDSEDSRYRLNYAVNDAEEIQKTVCEALRKRNNFSDVVPVPLVSKPTKRTFQTVLDLLAGRSVVNGDKNALPNADKITPARPEDTVLISFSCHGDGDRAGNFYLLPYDIGTADMHSKIEDIYPKCISSEELSKWLRDVDAGEMVMIIDACHSAAAVESTDFKPGPMGSRGLGQLAYDKGMRILAASQADNVALESANLKHGLLTYALVNEGLEASPPQADFKPKDGTILLSEWLAYGVDQLPKLSTERLDSRGVKLTTTGHAPAALVQEPSLFDFTKKKRDMILAKPEEGRK